MESSSKLHARQLGIWAELAKLENKRFSRIYGEDSRQINIHQPNAVIVVLK
jgi:hypothetical protein